MGSDRIAKTLLEEGPMRRLTVVTYVLFAMTAVACGGAEASHTMLTVPDATTVPMEVLFETPAVAPTPEKEAAGAFWMVPNDTPFLIYSENGTARGYFTFYTGEKTPYLVQNGVTVLAVEYNSWYGIDGQFLFAVLPLDEVQTSDGRSGDELAGGTALVIALGADIIPGWVADEGNHMILNGAPLDGYLWIAEEGVLTLIPIDGSKATTVRDGATVELKGDHVAGEFVVTLLYDESDGEKTLPVWIKLTPIEKP